MAYRFSYTPGELNNMVLESRIGRLFRIIGVWSGYPGGVQSIDLQEIDTGKKTKVPIVDFKTYVEDKDESGKTLLTKK